MKRKNISRKFLRHFETGWRGYQTIGLSYKTLGINPDDVRFADYICKTYGYTKDKENDPDHFLDYTNLKNGVPQTVIFSFHECSYLTRDKLVENGEIEANEVTYEKDGAIYWINLCKGWNNPKYDFLDDDCDEPFTIDDEPYTHEYFNLDDDDATIALEVLRRYVNETIFNDELWSGNIVCHAFFGVNGGNMQVNDIVKDMAELTNMCKVTYHRFTKDMVYITFGIRYPEYVKGFRSKLKGIILKHSVKKWY